MKGRENVIRCGIRGIWSIPEAYCQVSCPAPVRSTRKRKAVSRHCNLNYRSMELASLSFPVGASCKYACTMGYHIAGQSPEKYLLLVFYAQCKET